MQDGASHLQPHKFLQEFIILEEILRKLIMTLTNMQVVMVGIQVIRIGDYHGLRGVRKEALLDHLSLMMMGVGPGDEVITPSFNNAADFQAILACGAKPVFVDINENTLCIDTEKVEELITNRTKCRCYVSRYL